MLLTLDEVRDYLDECIRQYRRDRFEAHTPDEILMTRCYVDAFQSVRTTIFDELLPPEPVGDR